MTSGDVLNGDPFCVGNVVAGLFVKLSRLTLAVVALHDQDRAPPGLEQSVATLEPFLSEGGRVEVAGDGARDSRVREFLDDSFHLVGRDRLLAADPVVNPDDELGRVLHDARPRGVPEDVPLGRHQRVEVVQVLFASQVPGNGVRVVGDDVVALDRAAVVGDQVELLEPDSLEHAVELPGGAFVAVVARSFLGLSVTLQVHGDTPVSGRERGHLVVPLVPRVRDPVQEDDDFPIGATGLDVVPLDDFVVSRCRHKVVRKHLPVQLFRIAFLVARSRLDVSKRGRLTLDLLLVRHELFDNLLRPLRQRGVFQSRRLCHGCGRLKFQIVGS